MSYYPTIHPTSGAVTEDDLTSISGGTILKGFISGFEMASSNGVDVTISPGQCTDTATTKYLSGGAALKDMSSPWTAGMPGGGDFSGSGLPVNGTIHIHLIEKDSDGAVDYGWSSVIGGSDIPSGYTWRRRIGSLVTDSLGNVLPFIQSGDRFLLTDGVEDYISGQVDSLPSDGYRSLAIPTGLELFPIITAEIYAVSPTGSGVNFCTFSFAHSTDTSGDVADIPLLSNSTVAAYPRNTRSIDHVLSNSLGQIYTKFQGTPNDTVFRILTDGWIDGRND